MFLIRSELPMRLTEFIDEHGVKWITPARAAEIWNERAATEYEKEGHYSRWSVYQRAGLQTKPSTSGNLYREDEIRSVKLRPHPRRSKKEATA